jgi:serine/threonine protein kinase/tetratricopeptide (TPR) repeat protein
MIEEGKRVCQTCGTSLPVSSASCPVCALRNALDSGEGESTTALLLFVSKYRFEHYEIVIREDQKPLELGRGAMGVTYKATDTNLHCPVALKVINSQYLDDESVRQRFVAEARAAAGLRHPNVASVFHLGRVNGEYFYAMEFVDGGSLDRVLQLRGSLELDLALEIVNQVAGALSAGYRRGLVHRDIKPANLMVAFDEAGEVTVKVIDYGLARLTQVASGGTPEAERFVGTPRFASPEQCAGKDTDIRSDLYSLGVTLWVMLSGKPPFEGRISELIDKHQVESPPFEQLQDVPEPVVSLLQSLLAKDPRQRPQTPLELRARVREVQKALATESEPIYRGQEVRREAALSGEPPYRGLQVFDRENEVIFFGRTKERDEILGTLQARSIEENKPFVLIFGASGSGKSSLLRAGIMPWLCRPGVIEGVDLWRSALFRPSDHPGDLLEGLAETLLSPGALPDIGADGTDAPKLAVLLRKNPEGLGLLVKEALSHVAGNEKREREMLQQPVARLAVGLDQLEEIFTLSDRFSPESRVSFFKAIRAMVESGYGWVASTLRSDFFSRCEEIKDLVELKQGNGQYHLLPPSSAQLSQIIRYPAEAAGVVFEEDSEKGRLDERIRDDALKEPGGLPLLEYALDELFRMGSADGVLSHAEYEALGGVEGALRKRAEDAFAGLGPSEREALGPVLHQLVRLGSSDEETLARRVARYDTATEQPGAKGLVDAFVTARLLIADLDSRGDRSLTVAHEALFRVWPEISRWENENRDYLRVRARLGEAMARWIECNRQGDYLLAPGRPLAEAEDLLKNHETNLEPEEKSYILSSRARVARGMRRRRLVIAGVIAVLAAVAAAAIWEWRVAVQSENRAVSARSSAEGILNYLLNQLSDKLKPIGHLDIIEDVQKQVEAYYKDLGFGEEDLKALSNWATLLEQEGERLEMQGDILGAKAKYEQRLQIFLELVKREASNNVWQGGLAVSYYRLGDALQSQGDLSGAKAQYESSREISQKLLKLDPGNRRWQRNLSYSYERLGEVLEAQGDLSGGKAQYQSASAINEKLVKLDPGNASWQRGLMATYERLGDLLMVQGDFNGAKVQFQSMLEQLLQLTNRDPGNTDWQRDLSISYARLGNVLIAQQKVTAARTQYQSGLEIVQKLISQDPANSDWQGDLSVFYEKLGKVLTSLKDLSGAKAEYQRAIQIREQVAKKDQGNTVQRRDLATDCEELGSVLEAQMDLNGAKIQYQKALEIRQKLVKQDPGNSNWQHDWSETYKDLGALLKQQGDIEGAQQNFQASRDILTNLIRLHGENAAWKMDLDLVKKELGE